MTKTITICDFCKRDIRAVLDKAAGEEASND